MWRNSKINFDNAFSGYLALLQVIYYNCDNSQFFIHIAIISNYANNFSNTPQVENASNIARTLVTIFIGCDIQGLDGDNVRCSGCDIY